MLKDAISARDMHLFTPARGKSQPDRQSLAFYPIGATYNRAVLSGFGELKICGGSDILFYQMGGS